MTTIRDFYYALNTTAMRIDDDAAHDTLFALLFDDLSASYADAPATDDLPDAMRDMIRIFHSLSATDRATLYLDYDACPLHECDLAICADDDDPACAEMRHLIDLDAARLRAALAMLPRPS